MCATIVKYLQDMKFQQILAKIRIFSLTRLIITKFFRKNRKYLKDFRKNCNVQIIFSEVLAETKMCMRYAKFIFYAKILFVRGNNIARTFVTLGKFERSFAISENFENTSLFQQPLSLMQQAEKTKCAICVLDECVLFFFFLLGQ